MPAPPGPCHVPPRSRVSQRPSPSPDPSPGCGGTSGPSSLFLLSLGTSLCPGCAGGSPAPRRWWGPPRIPFWGLSHPCAGDAPVTGPPLRAIPLQVLIPAEAQRGHLGDTYPPRACVSGPCLSWGVQNPPCTPGPPAPPCLSPCCPPATRVSQDEDSWARGGRKRLKVTLAHQCHHLPTVCVPSVPPPPDFNSIASPGTKHPHTHTPPYHILGRCQFLSRGSLVIRISLYRYKTKEAADAQR